MLIRALITLLAVTSFTLRVSSQNFIENFDSPFIGLVISSSASVDIDGDEDLDIVLCGVKDSETHTRIYLNDGNGNFEEDTNNDLENVAWGTVALSDIDGDLDQDLIVSGWNNDFEPTTKLYTNNGLGLFSENTNSNIDEVAQSTLSFIDIDKDLDIDLMIAGYAGPKRITKLYLNNGNGVFTEDTNSEFIGLENAAFAFGDIDGDLDIDIFAGGTTDINLDKSTLYINDGLNNFTEDVNNNFPSINLGIAIFSDFDKDNDLDIFISGNSDDYVTATYTNNGEGFFTKSTSNQFEKVIGRAEISDIDLDGDTDLIVTGLNNQGESTANIYLNDGLGQFNKQEHCIFDESNFGSITIGDFDSDNDDDVIITGCTGPSTRYYINLAEGNVNRVIEEVNLDVFPNPITNNELNFDYFLNDNSRINIKVFAHDGRIVMEQEMDHICGSQLYSLDLESLNSGHYLLCVYNETRYDCTKLVRIE